MTKDELVGMIKNSANRVQSIADHINWGRVSNYDLWYYYYAINEIGDNLRKYVEIDSEEMREMEERDLCISVLMHVEKTKWSDEEIIDQIMTQLRCSAIYLDSYATSIDIRNEQVDACNRGDARDEL